MATLIVLYTDPRVPTPTAANSMPSPIEHMPCSVEVVVRERVRFALLPRRGWSSRVPLPTKPAGKMPSLIFHTYVAGRDLVPKYQLRRAEQYFDLAASKFVKLHADEQDIAGRECLVATPARHSPRETAQVTAPVSSPARGVCKRPRSSLPVKTAVKAPTMPKVEAKAKVEAEPIVEAEAEPEPEPAPKAEVKPKSILKPTKVRGADYYIRHCGEAPPGQQGGLRPVSESIAKSTVSRIPLSEWNIDILPINLPDRYKKLAFKSKETLDLEARTTKVVSLPLFLCSISLFSPCSWLLTFMA